MSTEWQPACISDISLGVFDGPHATPPISDEGPIYLGIGNITDDGHLDLSDVRHIAEKDFAQWTRRATPQPGDIVFTYEATLNRYAIIPDGFRGCLGRRTALIRPDVRRVDTRFLLYSFFGKNWRDTIEANRLSGATVDRIPIAKFPRFPILLPSLETQRRIASILGAYDNLIEVNDRRIALLKEMARRIFENAVETSRESGKEGTSVATIIDSTLGGDWGSDFGTPEEPCETRIIRGTDFRRIQSGDFSTAPKRYISQRSLERRLLRPFDIVVENSINAKTRNAGTPLLISAGLIKAFKGSVVAASFCRLFRCTVRESAVVLFHFLDRMQRNNEIRQFQVVAANGIANFQSEQFLKRAIIPLSPDMIGPVSHQLIPLAATTFQQQNSVLSLQRDLLLPRLMSGEVSVAVAERELGAVA